MFQEAKETDDGKQERPVKIVHHCVLNPSEQEEAEESSDLTKRTKLKLDSNSQY